MTEEEELKQNIVDQLKRDSRIDSSDIKVTVDGKSVTLEGTVPTYISKRAAEDDAWIITGVYNVINNLTIKYPTPPELPTDEEIKDRINDKFFWSSDIISTEIEVSVNAGEVKLEGEVETSWEKAMAETKALNTRGVLDVVNEIAVVPTKQIGDELIAEDIIESLENNIMIDIDDVTVKVNNGIVTLKGTVPNWSARSAAYDAALYTPGVVDVDNNILVNATVEQQA